MRSDSFTQPEVESGGRKRVTGGFLSAALGVVGVGGVLVWSMAAHDPYWRLYETSSVPAPAYESPAEIEAALASVDVAASAPDSVAVRPEAPGRLGDGQAPAELSPRPADPEIAVPVALLPVVPGEALADRGDVRAAGEAGGEPAAPTPGLLLATPELPEPRLSATGPIVAASAPAPVAVPAPPAPLWIAADEASEEALGLAWAERANVQRRLALAGFDPHGFDGVFGPQTRQAIADFQEAWSFPATGYLDQAVLADLHARTDEAYVALANRAAAEPRAAPKIAPVARERRLAADDSDGCARDADGRIIERQSFGCDLKGLAEQVISLGRNKLPHEEGTASRGSMAMAGNASGLEMPGAER